MKNLKKRPVSLAVFVYALCQILLLGLSLKAGYEWRRLAKKFSEGNSTRTQSKGPVTYIACSAEKIRWLEWVAGEFAKTEEGKQCQIRIVRTGSRSAIENILAEQYPVHAWSPSASAYGEIFAKRWIAKYHSDPFLYSNSIASSPIVGLTSASALMNIDHSSGGANELFLFAQPGISSSGDGVSLMSEGMFKRADESTDYSSEGVVVRFLLKGPVSGQTAFVYENVALEYFLKLPQTSSDVLLMYPKTLIWADHPFYILRAPWVKNEQQQICQKFARFLLSSAVQSKAAEFGFRMPETLQFAQLPDGVQKKWSERGMVSILSKEGAKFNFLEIEKVWESTEK